MAGVTIKVMCFKTTTYQCGHAQIPLKMMQRKPDKDDSLKLLMATLGTSNTSTHYSQSSVSFVLSPSIPEILMLGLIKKE